MISGATRGIGRVVAEKFADKGFDIAFCSRTHSDVVEFEKSLKDRFGIRAKGFTADLTKVEEIKEFGKAAIDFLGGLDILYNNAGVFMPGSIENESDETFNTQMSINLGAAYHLSKLGIPSLKKGHRPHIFNMCSIASIVAYPNGASYCISKFAVLGLTKVLREELKTAGVCVTAVMPGATLTESWGDVSQPKTRFMRPSDIAEAVWATYTVNEHTNIEEILMRPLKGDI